MKTKEQIQARIEEYKRMLDDEENQNEIMQVKLYAYIYALEWTLKQ